ncbi:MAG: C39 family peptidase [Patescibacteria group bacterium]
MVISISKRTITLLLIGFGIVTYFTTQFWPLPETLLLDVPFTNQAPTGMWDRNEDCEEASIAMAQAYLSGDTENLLPSAGATSYISRLRAWKQANIGYNADTGAYATSRMAEGAFGITVKQIHNYTETDLKRALAKNHVVLLPIDARMLGAQSYTNSGPTYHMVVVRGYTATHFIVNDPGTTGGNGVEYSFDTLFAAAADWNNAAKIMDSTIKVALILS